MYLIVFHRKPTNRLVFSLVAAFALVMVFSGIWVGFKNANQLLDKQHKYVSGALSKLEDEFRTELLMGERNAFLAKIQAFLGVLGLEKIEVKEINGEVSRVFLPFSSKKTHKKLGTECKDFVNVNILEMIFSKCITQSLGYYFDMEKQNRYLTLTWDVSDDLRRGLIDRVLLSVLTALGIALILGTFGNKVVRKYVVDPLITLSSELESLADSIQNHERATLPKLPNVASKELIDLAQSSRIHIERILNLEKENQEISVHKARSELGAQVAHDIKSPLAALNVLSELSGEFTEEHRRLLKFASRRVEEITLDLSFGAQQRRKVDLQKKIFSKLDVLALLSNLILEKEVEWSNTSSTINYIKPENENNHMVLANSTDLNRVFSNILNNAKDANAGVPNPRPIEVMIYSNREYVCIEVKDFGVGIDDEKILKIFKKGESFGKDYGSGLGLYHAANIISDCRGEICVKSNLGVETTFIIKVPLTVGNKLSNSNIRAVLLDDNIFVREAWQLKFEANGMKVLAFSSIKEISNSSLDINRDIPFFLDSELEDGRGEDIGELLIGRGFTNLYISSGYEESHFDHLNWPKGFVGKDPPEWLFT